MPSSPNVTNIPAPRVELIDARTGLMTREWYRFFFNLFNLTGAGTTTITLQDLQVGPSNNVDNLFTFEQQIAGLSATPSDTSLQSQIAVLQNQVESLSSNPPPLLDVPTRFLPPSGIALSASPFTYQNTKGYSGDVIVSGGTVSAIEFSRNNTTFYSVGATSGVFWLSPYDYLRVTYTVAPTLTFVPR